MINPRVFIYGYFGFGNVGDDLLLRSVIEHVRRRFGGAQITVRSYKKVDGYETEKDIDFLCSENILLDNSLTRIQRLLNYLSTQWNSLRSCSHFIFGGGTVFHARDGSSTNLLLIFFLALMARIRGGKVYALGVGVAPIQNVLPRLLMSLIFFLIADFVVRDETSYANCRKLYGGRRVRLSADLVFTLPVFQSLPIAKSASKVVGLTVAASDIDGVLGRYPRFVDELRLAVKALGEAGWTVRLLSFQELELSSGVVSDLNLFGRLLGDVQNLQKVRVSAELPTLLSQFLDIDLVVGMRFHGLVIASMLGKPFVAFGRDQKLSDFSALLAMPFVALDSFSSTSLCDAVEVAGQKDIPTSLVDSLRTKALSNFQELDRSAT